MLDIGIPEISVTAKYEDTDHRSIRYDAEASVRPSKCINLDCTSKLVPNRHDSTEYMLHDVKAEGKLSYINLRIRRYKCPDCGQVFPDEFTFFTKRQHITHRLKDEIITRCIKGETFRYIANDYVLDPNTVASIFKEYAAAHKEELSYEYTPEVLGIDEAHIDDHYRLVLTDIVKQRLLDIKPNNHQRTVVSYLRTLDPSICKCATMDFAPAYAKAVSIVLPKALIVIDKFHVVQEVNRCLDNVRKDIQNAYRAQGVDIRRFKRVKYLFMTNWEDLSASGMDKLSEWFREFYDLYDAYMCKESFRDIYITAKSKKQAVRMFDEWVESIPDFERFAPMRKTMHKRRDHILNYWDCPWTNAYTESTNNAIKKIEKAGRGYKFETLRERCLLEINHPKPDKFDPKTATYVQTVSAVPSKEKQSEKVRKLYAPDAKPVYKVKSSPYPKGSYGFMAPSKSPDMVCTYQPYNGSLGDYVEVYLEMHDSRHREESFQKRMLAYYERLRELNL